MVQRSRAWQFTTNNYGAQQVDDLKELDCAYLIFGKEAAGTTGTPHLQGYVYFPTQRSFKSVKNQLPDGSHIEAVKGTAQQNIDYCSKEGDVFTKGEPPKHGARTDIKEFTQVIRSGKTDHELIDLDPGKCARYTKYISFVRQARLQRKTMQPVKVTVIVGNVKSGKEKAYADYPDLYNHTHQYGNWFCKYNGESAMLIHNFDDSIEEKILIPLLEQYPLMLPVKCYHTYKAWDNVIITSRTHPRDWSIPWDRLEDYISEVITIS